MSVAREFQTVGAAQRKARSAKWVPVNGLYSSGAVDEHCHECCQWWCWIVDVVIQSADAAAVQSPQPSALPQSSDDSDNVLMQSAELKRTEMKLLRQIESIQEERSVFALDEVLSYALSPFICCVVQNMEIVIINK